MLIPSITEAQLRTAKVYAYDPFPAETATAHITTFLTAYPYAVGDQLFDGTSYQTVVAVTGRSDTTEPVWSTVPAETTVSGGVTFRNDGPDLTGRFFFAEGDAIRVSRNSAAFIRVTFPDTITPAVETATLMLDCACFNVASTSRMVFNPTVGVRPPLAFALAELVAVGEVLPPPAITADYAAYVTDADLSGLSSLRALPTHTPAPKVYAEQKASAAADVTLTTTLRLTTDIGLVSMSSQMVIGTFNLSRVTDPTLDIYSQSFPETWPPAYLDLADTATIPVPTVGAFSFDLTPFLDPAVRTYTFLLYRADPVVRTSEGVVRAENEPDPYLLNAAGGMHEAPHVMPLSNRKHLDTALGGPYLGYILDTYETATGITRPIPWFEASEAKRIAVKLTETNYFAEEPDIEIEVSYNSASQQFVFTQTDHRFDGLERLRGLRTELARIDPVRVGDTLLYPLASYDVPWLIAKPEQVSRLVTSTRAANARLSGNAALEDERFRLKADFDGESDAESWGYVDEA